MKKKRIKIMKLNIQSEPWKADPQEILKRRDIRE